MAQTRQKSGNSTRKSSSNTRNSSNKRASNTRTSNTRTSNTRSSSNRKSTSSAGTIRKRNSGKRRTKAEMARAARNRQFAIVIVTFIICTFALISNFNLLGSIGKIISTVQFGLVGWLAYALPVLLFVLIAFLVFNFDILKSYIKASEGIIFFIAAAAIAELISVGTSIENVTSAKDSYVYSGEYHSGGGYIGGLVTFILVPKLGQVGTWIALILLLIVFFVLIAEINIVELIGDLFYDMYDSSLDAKAERKALKEENSAKRKDRERLIKQKEEQLNARRIKRMEMTVEGVAVDTLVGNSKKDNKSYASASNMDVREIVYENIPEADLSEQSMFDESDIEREIVNGSNVSTDPDYIFSDASHNILDKDIVMEEHGNSFMDLPRENFKEIFKEDSEEDYLKESEGYFEEDYQVDNINSSINDFQDVTDEEHQNDEYQNENISIQLDKTDVAKVNAYEDYRYPPINLLKLPAGGKKRDGSSSLNETATKLQQTLKNFGVDATVTDFSKGPAVTRFEIQLAPGVKVSKITNLQEDIKLNLAAADIRIEAPIPGKPAVGIEVPNREKESVSLRELIDSEDFRNHTSRIAFASGRDIAGKVVIADIGKMPHVLIAGATGSGKSVCINTIIMSILYKARPDEVKLIMIDPKVVELSVYNGIPHLLIPVVTDPKKAAGALNWAVAEMDRRYRMFSEFGVRDMKGFNEKVEALPKDNPESQKYEKMPQIVVIVDELADLMMTAPSDVEGAICRLAQLARAAGIHLVIATQRPSVNVITGLIKANMPSRIAFSVTSGVDSRTILDMNGAEKLLGMGDMLYFPQNLQKPLRVQGAFVSDKEVADVVDFLKKKNGDATYDSSIENSVNNVTNSAVMSTVGQASDDDRDILFMDVGKFLIESEKGSIGVIQRKFKVGFNRAARIMDQLEEAGVVGPEEGTKPRKILMSLEEFEQYIEEYV